MKNVTAYRTVLWFFSLFGVLTFIFANSLTPAADSSAESGRLWIALRQYFPMIEHWAIRKLAHFLEYALLGAHMAFAPILLPMALRVSLPTSFFFGAVIALLDEGVQRFVPGRAGSLTDSLIDYFGYLCGVLLLTFVFFLVSRKRRKSHE